MVRAGCRRILSFLLIPGKQCLRTTLAKRRVMAMSNIQRKMVLPARPENLNLEQVVRAESYHILHLLLLAGN